MVSINKQGNAIVITFTDNDKYLFNGTIEVAPNELVVVTDKSDMATFRKASNGDVLFSQLIKDIQINGSGVTKENIIQQFASIGFSSSGGAVESVNGQTGAVVLTADSIGAISKQTADATYQPKGDFATKQELAGKLDTATYNSEKASFETKENAAATYQVKGDYAIKSELPKLVTLTQSEYDGLATKDENTYYFIKEG